MTESGHRWSVTLSVAFLGGLLTLLVVGPLISDFEPDELDWNHLLTPPSLSSGHILGTDAVGRDVFIRVLAGGKVSLLVGLVAALVSVVIGVTYGLLAGLAGGRTQRIMMRLVDILYALPFMFLVIVLMALFGRHFILLFVAIGCYIWLDMARIVRGQVLQLNALEFVEAARSLGARPAAVVWRHLLPNLWGPVVVYATLTIPQVVLVESFLSFLGLGIQEPQTSWGVLISEGAAEMELAPWLLIAPAALLTLTLVCLNLLGDALRDTLDPRQPSHA